MGILLAIAGIMLILGIYFFIGIAFEIIKYLINPKNFKKIIKLTGIVVLIVLCLNGINKIANEKMNEKVNEKVNEFYPLIEEINNNIIGNIDANYEVISTGTTLVSNNDGKTFYSERYRDMVVDYGETSSEKATMVGVFNINNNTNYDLYNIRLMEQVGFSCIDLINSGESFEISAELFSNNKVYFEFLVKDFELGGVDNENKISYDDIIWQAVIDLENDKVSLYNISIKLPPNTEYSSISLYINFCNKNDETSLSYIELVTENSSNREYTYYEIKRKDSEKWSIMKTR